MADRSALFVIDIQNSMATNPETRIPDAESLNASAGKVLATARSIVDSYRSKSEQSPAVIVVVQHEESPESGDLVRGTEPWGVVFPPRDGVAEERLVAKTHGNTFESNPDLAASLKQEGITRIFTCGIQSDMCVEMTSKGALQSGFDVTVLSGAHGTYPSGGKSAAEVSADVDGILKELGAKIVKWEDAVAAWEKENRLCPV